MLSVFLSLFLSIVLTQFINSPLPSRNTPTHTPPHGSTDLGTSPSFWQATQTNVSDREQSSVCACVWGITIKRMREYRCLGLRDKRSCLCLWQLLMLSQTLIGCEFERQPGGGGGGGYWVRDPAREWKRESETRSWKRGSNGPPLWNLPVLDNIWLNFPMRTSSWHAAIWERETHRERGMKTSRKNYWLERFTSVRSSRRGGPVLRGRRGASRRADRRHDNQEEMRSVESRVLLHTQPEVAACAKQWTEQKTQV